MAFFTKISQSFSSSNNPSDMDNFWFSPLRIMSSPVWHFDPLKGEELYNKQIEELGNAILIEDYSPNITVDQYDTMGILNCKFPNKGELVSGSFIARSVCKSHFNNDNLSAEDIDIYFKNIDDAKEFVKLNEWGYSFSFHSPVCSYGNPIAYTKINLIYGIDYTSPANLITRFDIRACSMCYDPNTKMLYSVRGSMNDVLTKEIVFNSVPRGVSVRRLLKYYDKGFKVEKHQRLYFAELLRSDLYSKELELHTKDY